MNAQQAATDIFLAGVKSVKPNQLISGSVTFSNNRLTLKNKTIDLEEIRYLYVIGAGKASASMAKELEFILGDRIKDGLIITKYDHSVPLDYIRIKEAGHPVPDQNGLEGTREILKIAQQAGGKDLIICLLSGGGSALLADLPEGSTLDDLAALNSMLLECGANINEMNCIRKHLSAIKGGLLSKAVWPAQIVSLILSDVIGDRLDVIASGPTAPDPTTFADAIGILKKYQIEDKIPQHFLQYLLQGIHKKGAETLKESDEIFQRTTNIIIGSNLLALKSAKEKAESSSYHAHIITSSLEGDICEVADYITENIKRAVKSNSGEKTCLLFGGEPTIKVAGRGKGGRNQHLALMIAKKIDGIPGVTFLSGGTDGSDGPTDAAGAAVNSNTSKHAMENGLNTDYYLEHSDSYNFFKKEGGHIITGPTKTNVMDLKLALIE
jgi:glycerate 2-kinase